jgi:hypothetical protein
LLRILRIGSGVGTFFIIILTPSPAY